MSSSARTRTVLRSAGLRPIVPGGGFDRAVSLNRRVFQSDLSPFVDLTIFDMSLPVFRPHPHAGFSAVTYMFEDSPGTFRNRWTAGPDNLIGPGSIHWTRAGSGMMHEEVPTEPGVACRGLQMFVKLDPEHELDAPQAFHLDTHEIDEVEVTGSGRVRVLAGQYLHVTSRLGLPDVVTFLDIHLEPHGTIEIPAPASWNAFVFVRRGSIETAGIEVRAEAAATFHHDGETVAVQSHDGAQLLFGTGPHAGPEVPGGPFILSTQQRLNDAERRFVNGEMGSLAPSFSRP